MSEKRLISKKELIAGMIVFYKNTSWYEKTITEYLETIWNSLETPSGWVSVSERLPEKEGFYLCTVKKDYNCIEVLEQYFYYETKTWNYYMNVIAWCELPEAYKGE